ncbi:MAG: hypothetical protein M3083_22380 [Actinomycetota bacterium]|nr:hypothetical protein [Actinomycetota bacterium]MDQ6944796.1 hypothetical protein [Actinomycetota bacterium]
MSAADISSEVKAALLWNVPALRSAGDAALAFHDVFSLRGLRDAGGLDTAEPLAIAARGFQAELEGRLREAEELYRSLLIDMGFGPRLLGLALLAWMPSDDPSKPLDYAAEAVSESSDSELKAHYFCKLMGFCLDRGLKARAEQYYDRALEFSGASPGLLQVLSAVGYNEFSRPFLFREQTDDRSDLVTLPWVSDVAAVGTRGVVLRQVRARAMNPWSRTIRFGPDEVNPSTSAEVQAEWAGAVWLLPDLREQLGAQMLLSAEGLDAAQSVYALSMWILGGGDDIAEIVDLVEPRFSATSPDELLKVNLHGGRRLGAERAFVPAALALWDLISDTLCDELLESLPVVASVQLVAQRTRDLWNMLGLRRPDTWWSALLRMPTEVQDWLLDEVQPALMELVGDDIAHELAPRLLSRWQSAPDNLNIATACLVLSLRPGCSELMDVDDLVNHASPSMKMELLGKTGSAMVRPDLATIEALVDQVVAENEQYRQGSQGFGGHNVRFQLGAALAFAAEEPEAALQVLADTAADPHLPLDFRFDAIEGLLNVAAKVELVPSTVEKVFEAPISGSPSFVQNVTAELVQCAVTSLRAFVAPDTSTLRQLAVFMRRPDPRVRQVATTAVGRIAGSGTSFASTLLVSALFDPEQTVVVEGLRRLRESSILQNDNAPVIINRLRDLYDTGTRNVRAEVAKTAQRFLEADDQLAVRDLVNDALEDRSWRVRRAARNPPG